MSISTRQPKVKVPYERQDYIMEGFTILGLLVFLGALLFYYPSVPNEIPVHFNSKGIPDVYGDKSILWLIFGVTVGVFMLLFWVNKNPHLGNYPVEVNESNALKMYRYIQRMNRGLNLILVYGFTYMVYVSIQISMGKQTDLGLWFMLLVLVGVFSVVGYYLYRLYQKQ